MTILIIIAVIVALVLIAAAFSSSKYLIEREVVINEPKQAVFDYVKHICNQEHYNKWVMADLNAKKTLTGTDGTVGFIYAWDSTNKNVGKGEQEITKIEDGLRIDSEVRFEKPLKNVANSYISVEALAQNETKVKFGLSGNLNYGMKLMYMIFSLKKVLGKDIQTSLLNLKAVVEK